MFKLQSNSPMPGLLVSVRNASEALAALAGGADVIDVKEPDRGPLGAADARTIEAVVRAVNSRAPVTAALGELVDLNTANCIDGSHSVSAGVSLFKIGLAGCGRIADWQSCWRDAIASLNARASGRAARPVAVAYADWRAACAPEPDDVLQAAVDLGCPALLVDTWSKAAGCVFDHWPIDDLCAFLDRTRAQQRAVVLAGSLIDESFAAAVRLAPDLMAVRTAACDAGRGGTVSAGRVRRLKEAIVAASGTSDASVVCSVGHANLVPKNDSAIGIAVPPRHLYPAQEFP